MKKLNNIEILSINTFNSDRSIKAINYSCKEFEFERKTVICSNQPTIDVFDINIITIPHFDTRDGYSEFCIKHLYKHVISDYVLMVHDDGFIINPHLWDDAFLEYDYIGAPWPEQPTGGNRVGNGGFCLRSKKLINLCKDLDFTIGHEDWEISRTKYDYFISNGCTFAPVELAAKFSLELQIPEVPYNLNNSFGFHGYRSPQHYEKINLLNSI